MKKHAFVIVLALAFAGCLQAPADPAAVEPAATNAPPLPDGAILPKPGMIRGVVQSVAVEPIGDATVKLLALNATTRTDAAGRFQFVDAPEGRHLLHVNATGFEPKTIQAVVERGMAYEVNVTLLPVVPVEPRQEIQELKGFLSCSFVLQTPGDGGHAARRKPTDCGAADPNSKNTWEIDVARDARGVIIEEVWEPGSPAASHLDLIVETVDYGSSNAELGFAHAEAGYGRIEIPGEAMEKFYPAGGAMLVKTQVGPSVSDDESTANAGVAVQQPVTVYVSVFYHAPPPSGFTVLKK